jgi:LasA protease
VQGTCQDGACGMKVRTAPSLSAPSVGVVLDGQAIDVACQGGGDAVSNGRATSSIWDRLADGTWVSDFYVDTANVGRPSPPIPACA